MPAMNVKELVEEMKETCKEGPFFFYDLLKAFESVPYRDILIAWGELREQLVFDRDEEGHYVNAREK